MRAKSPLDGWAYAKSERTVLRKVDHGEDDGHGLRGDFRRLRAFSADLSDLPSDSRKKLDEALLSDNLRLTLITTVPITVTGPPSDEWANCRQSKAVHREPSLYRYLTFFDLFGVVLGSGI